MAEDQPPTQVSPDILHALGIKEDHVKKYDKEVIDLKKSGADKYRRLLNRPMEDK